MISVTEEFGINAGRVWKALNQHDSLTESQLLEETSLRKEELNAAIGWLARENKIRKEGDSYSLGNTNLTVKIGGDAGKIWKLLNTWNEVNSDNITDYLDVEEDDKYSALGWLAREGKIQLKRGEKK